LLRSRFIIPAMPTPPTSQLQLQLNRLNTTGFAAKLAQAAQADGFPVAFFYAIASRETNCQNILGDKQSDGFHGVGIVQIDIQNPIAKQARDDGSWQTNPDPLINFGGKLIASNWIQVKHILPNLSDNDQLKVVAAGYNCGVGRSIRAAGFAAADPDIFTTGKDYGKDVMARMAIFTQLLTPAS
jgi:hypothetical protein